MLIAQNETAIASFHAHVGNGKAAAQRNRILGFIEAQGGDWSIGEIAHALGLEKSTVSARVNECLNEFQSLVVKPRRKDRRSGINIRPVGLPVKQQEMLN